MNCSKCGKSDKSMEVFHLSENMSVSTCMECMNKPKEFKDNVRIVTIQETRIVDVYYAIQLDDDDVYQEDSPKILISEVDRCVTDTEQQGMVKPANIAKNHWIQRPIEMLLTGDISATEHLFKD